MADKVQRKIPVPSGHISIQGKVIPMIDDYKLYQLGFIWQVCTGADNIPPNAVPCGDVTTGKKDKEGKEVKMRLFVARAQFEKATYGAKCSPGLNKGGCNFVAHDEGKELHTSLYDVLTAPDNIQARIVWKTCKTIADMQNLENPVCGGLEDAANNPLLIARVEYKNGFHAGYVAKPTDPGICFGWGGKHQYETENFQVMTIPGDLEAMINAPSSKAAQTAPPPPQTGPPADDPSAPYQKYVGKDATIMSEHTAGKASELTVAKDDRVTIEAVSKTLWVKGTNVATKATGWFPLVCLSSTGA